MPWISDKKYIREDAGDVVEAVRGISGSLVVAAGCAMPDDEAVSSGLLQPVRTQDVAIGKSFHSLESPLAQIGTAPFTAAEVLLGSEAFDVTIDINPLPAGLCIFTITNIGYGHELLVVKTDSTADELIAEAVEGEALDETGWDIRVDTGTIAHSGTALWAAMLEAGHYVFICNEAGHTHLGMAIDVEVTGDSSVQMV